MAENVSVLGEVDIIVRNQCLQKANARNGKSITLNLIIQSPLIHSNDSYVLLLELEVHRRKEEAGAALSYTFAFTSFSLIWLYN
jgi:hypothetical protein